MGFHSSGYGTSEELETEGSPKIHRQRFFSHWLSGVCSLWYFFVFYILYKSIIINCRIGLYYLNNKNKNKQIMFIVKIFTFQTNIVIINNIIKNIDFISHYFIHKFDNSFAETSVNNFF